LPNERIVYAGDTARAPYGGLSPETLLSHSREIVHFLLRQNVKAVVLACGTSSSTAYDALRAEFPDMILVDVIRPGVKACAGLAAARPGLRVGFIATAATVKKGLFVELLKKARPGIHVEARACPLFAPMAERGLFTSRLTRWAAETYLSDWKGKIDALVLGCTHYPLLSGLLEQILSPAHIIDLSAGTAEAVSTELKKRDALAGFPGSPTHEFYVSGAPDAFDATARTILDTGCRAKPMRWRRVTERK
jgi:glutamate racemase